MESLLLWYRSGGPLMMPLLIVGLFGILLLAERVRHIILRSRISARPFMERVISLTRSGKVDEALTLCAEHQSVLPDLGLVLLRSRSGNEAELRAIAEASTLTVVPSLKLRLRWMPMLALLALSLGVLGAIINLHDALGGTGSVRDAVRFAIRPLGAGVLASIAPVVGHSFLQSQVQATLELVHEFSARLINALLNRPDVRLGHRE